MRQFVRTSSPPCGSAAGFWSRSPGSGSSSKREKASKDRYMKGSIQKRGDRTYRLRVDLGFDASGRRIQRSLTVRGSRKEAEKKLADILHEIHKGEYVGPSALTVAEYMRYWLENYARKLAAR